MQHGGEPDARAEVLGVCCDGNQGLLSFSAILLGEETADRQGFSVKTAFRFETVDLAIKPFKAVVNLIRLF
jgi:hypothetical protein